MAGKLVVGPVLIIFVVANGVFVARVIIGTVHLPFSKNCQSNWRPGGSGSGENASIVICFK